MVTRNALDEALKQLLEPQFFRDYAPNGLQVEGKSDIARLVTGVTASQALIDQAIAQNADAILVHHGYFWKGEPAEVVGMKQRRLKSLLAHDINLFAYHLPLDAHPELGNNAQLAQRLGIQTTGPLQVGNQRSIGSEGQLADATSVADFAQTITQALGREPLVISGGDHLIKRVAWCTGGAQSYIEQAVALGVDAFITGEASEQTTHIARECGVHFFAAGHHATERYGVLAVGDYLAQQLAIEHHFMDIENPV